MYNIFDLLEVSLRIFFLLNPLASLPLIFIAYKKGFNVKKIALNAVIIAFLIALSFIFVGNFLFLIFGITLDSFRIAGGILIISLGFEMVISREKETSLDITKPKSLISIIATPFLTGPATLSFLTILVIDRGIVFTFFALILAFIFVAFTFLILTWFIYLISIDYIEFVSRIFGLFVMAFGVEMLTHGIKNLFFS